MLWTPHVTVATVIERDGRFLIVEEEAPEGIVYNQPAGHWEEDEDLTAGALRETLEETAWEVELTGLIGVYHWRRPDGEETYLRFCFAARPLRHNPERALDAGIQQALWLDRAEIAALGRQLRSPLVLRCIDDYLAGQRYPLNLVTRM